MGPIQTLDELIDMVRRRMRLMLIVTVLGCVFSVLFALSQKPMYQSTETIQIVRPASAGDPRRMADAAPLPVHLKVIEQRLMARRNMLEVIDAYNLFAEYPELKPGEMVNRLRRAVTFESVVAPSGGPAGQGTISVLSITATMPIAMQARQVAQELTRRMISLNNNARVQQAAQVSVIDPAALPDVPVSDIRKPVAVLGSVLSVVLAFLVAFFQDLRNPVIRTGRQMQREIGFGPLVSIPVLDPTPLKVTRWRRLWSFLADPDNSDGSPAT